MARILVADDEVGIREFVADALDIDGHDVTCAADGGEAARCLDNVAYDLLVTDLKMPVMDGMALLHKVRAEQPEVEVVMLTAHGTVSTAVEAMKAGAFDYLQKPIESPSALRMVVTRALERRQLIAARERTERDTAPRSKLTFGDPAMAGVVTALRKVARTNASVLLTGESGVGKEVAARAVHDWSGRAGGPFVAINCAALPEALLESELFGHEKGAFSGAHTRRRGRIELAAGGTFFLDEVGELDIKLQAKLLRVLQEKRYERVGGERTLEADVRWIAATNRRLEDLIVEGSFREDLYHRLAVFPVRIPPLRERPADIVPLARVLLAGIARELGVGRLQLSEAAEHRLRSAEWRGNVRALRNTLERAAILADGPVVEPEQLTPSGVDALPGSAPVAPADDSTLADLEREAIQRALASVGGHRKKAAERLGIGLRTLYDKLKKYGLD